MEIDGAELRRLREDAGLDMSGLASAASISRSYVSMLESGERASCSAPVASRIAQALDVAIADLRSTR